MHIVAHTAELQHRREEHITHGNKYERNNTCATLEQENTQCHDHVSLTRVACKQGGKSQLRNLEISEAGIAGIDDLDDVRDSVTLPCHAVRGCHQVLTQQAWNT